MSNANNSDDMRPEYNFDFSKGVRGKHYKQYMESSNVVVLDSDVAASFPNASAVNAALRAMLQFTAQASNLTSSHTSKPQGKAR
ncbi:MAG: hypothetical protein EPO42_08815 [Gallionellaceae bacterium]|nr:MAG: hypothetical protein EPO42_08815 [Gallionellaceae bacterium]